VMFGSAIFPGLAAWENIEHVVTRTKHQ
jgi:hypothetical protein